MEKKKKKISHTDPNLLMCITFLPPTFFTMSDVFFGITCHAFIV